MPEILTQSEKELLLSLARSSLEAAVTNTPLAEINSDDLPEKLNSFGATFITLTFQGTLRGCIGSLEAYQPLYLDVCEHAAAAALNDFRFPPVHPDELEEISIEISYLTCPVAIQYTNEQDLITKIRPGIDGVVVKDGSRRATFLPKVWEKIPEPAQFLNHLCQKMGSPPDLWRNKKLEISLYQVEDFGELVPPG